MIMRFGFYLLIAIYVVVISSCSPPPTSLPLEIPPHIPPSPTPKIGDTAYGEDGCLYRVTDYIGSVQFGEKLICIIWQDNVIGQIEYYIDGRPSSTSYFVEPGVIIEDDFITGERTKYYTVTNVLYIAVNNQWMLYSEYLAQKSPIGTPTPQSASAEDVARWNLEAKLQREALERIFRSSGNIDSMLYGNCLDPYAYPDNKCP